MQFIDHLKGTFPSIPIDSIIVVIFFLNNNVFPTLTILLGQASEEVSKAPINKFYLTKDGK